MPRTVSALFDGPDAPFLRAALHHLDDPTARLVYADWLEDHGDPRGEFLRSATELAELPPGHPDRAGLEDRQDRARRMVPLDWLALFEGSHRYTMFWPEGLCQSLRDTGAEGTDLRVVWGGYNQDTQFRAAKVRPGDYVYPIRTQDGLLSLVARMRVVSVAACDASPEGSGKPVPPWNPAASEVLLGEGGTPVRFDQPLPRTVVERLRFHSPQGERAPKHLVDGRLTRSISVQGIYRLTRDSARDFDLFLADPQFRRQAEESSARSRPRRRAGPVPRLP